MDFQSNQNQKGIAYLNSKAWYRFLKFMYGLILGLTIGLAIGMGLIVAWPSLILIAPIAILLVFEIVKRSLYCIVTGRIFPRRQEMATLPSELYLGRVDILMFPIRQTLKGAPTVNELQGTTIVVPYDSARQDIEARAIRRERRSPFHLS